MELLHGDALELLKGIPAESVDLVLTDPPYNIGKAEWDKIPNYVEWCGEWFAECERVLKNTGILYWWHNDMPQIAQLMNWLAGHTTFYFRSFIVWDKGEFRAKSWKRRDPDGATALRSWFPVCEYCLHYFKGDGRSEWDKTGLQRVHNNAGCFAELKTWYAAERDRLGLTEKEIGEKYTEVTGRKPHMLRHYYKDSQFEIPTRAIWEGVYQPLGFERSYEDLRASYEDLRASYEDLRASYEDLRHTHNCDDGHKNIFSYATPPNGADRIHPTQKPVDMMRRLIRVSSNPGDVVLDPFMGSGSTGVACVQEGRDFIGIERDGGFFKAASERIRATSQQLDIFGECGGQWRNDD